MGAGRQGRERARTIAPAETRQAAPYVAFFSASTAPERGVAAATRSPESGRRRNGDRRSESEEPSVYRSSVSIAHIPPFSIPPHPSPHHLLCLLSSLCSLRSFLFSLLSFLFSHTILFAGLRFVLLFTSLLFPLLFFPRLSECYSPWAKWGAVRFQRGTAWRKCGLRIAEWPPPTDLRDPGTLTPHPSPPTPIEHCTPGTLVCGCGPLMTSGPGARGQGLAGRRLADGWGSSFFERREVSGLPVYRFSKP